MVAVDLLAISLALHGKFARDGRIGRVRIEVRSYDHPDAAKLIDAVQRENAERYGTPDETPVDPGEFAGQRGTFLVGYVDGTPVACGGWRVCHVAGSGPEGDAEIKRMYVAPDARRSGYAQRILAELERTALAAGHRRAILETGDKQPEAIGLYRKLGYADIVKFGHYADEPESLSLGKAL